MPCKCGICGFTSGVTEDFTKWPNIPNHRPELYPVTKNGKSTGEVLNFICARCLGNANLMRIFVKGMMSGVQVTDHAVSRFIERIAPDITDKQTARLAVLRSFTKARRIRFRSGFMVSRIISNDFTEAEYYWDGNLIFVIVKGDPPKIVTVERLWGRKLNKDFVFADTE